MSSKKIVVIADVFADMVTHIVGYPKEGDGTNGTPLKRNSGGCGGNIAAGLGVLGVDTHVVCRLGEDDNGKFLADDMAKDGVNVSGISYDKERGTGTTIIAVTPHGERTIWMLTQGSAFEYLAVEDLEYIDKLQPDAIFVSGVIMGSEPAAGNLLSYLPKWKGKVPLYFDPNLRYPSDAVPAYVKDNMQACCNMCDIILTGKGEMEALEFVQQPGQTFIVKDSINGSVLLDEKGDVAFHIPSTKQETVDATGAGDTYASAFTAYHMEGKSVREAMVFATAAAGLSVLRSGARSCPTREEAEQYIKEHGLA